MISPLLASLKSTSKRFNFAVLQNENEEAFAREENQLRTESNWIIIIKNALVLFWTEFKFPYVLFEEKSRKYWRKEKRESITEK